jgi:hypothetical protein
MKKYRIAILFHEMDNMEIVEYSIIKFFAKYWREDEHEVIFLFGIDEFVPADLIFVHVDLSVVPDSYLEFAQQYPVAINGKVKDVRKSTYSQSLLKSDDHWDGPVIVKTDKNCAGTPELIRGGLMGRVQKKVLKTVGKLNLDIFTPNILTANDYEVYDHLDEVPNTYFYHPGLVIEKFIPEIDGEHYVVRMTSFLGDRYSSFFLKGKDPILKGDTAETITHTSEYHPDVDKWRKELNFDYGKFDYVVREGKAILLDANKTVGCSTSLEENKQLDERRRYRARGLYSYLSA